MTTELKTRTKKFSLSVIDFAEQIDYSFTKKIVLTQLVRSGTSVGANYRAANRARSDKEFIAKIHIVLEEVDEALFWLEIIEEKRWADTKLLMKEADELTAIFVTILKKMNQKATNNK